VPDIDFEFRALDSLRVPRAPIPPPAIYLDGDTIAFDAFRGRLADSLRALAPRFRAFPDSLERARIDSIRQRIEREMRARQDEMRRFSEAHREQLARLQHELRERMLEEQPQRLRDQAEALRRQAERLEEQAREMEQQRTPRTDTTETSRLRGAPSFDAAPWVALRGGSPAMPGQPVRSTPVTVARTAALTDQATWHARVDREAVAYIAQTAAALGRAALAASHRGAAPAGSSVLWRAERSGERFILR
jgi:exonuclease VII large subunit